VSEEGHVEDLSGEKLSVIAEALAAMPTGFYVVDTEGHEDRVAYANPAFADLLGFGSPDDIVGKSVSAFYVDPSEKQSIFEESRRAGEASMLSLFRGRTSSGETIDLAVTANNVVSQQGDRVLRVLEVRAASEEERRVFGGAPKLFMSYSHSDAEFASRLATDLLQARFSVWLDTWEIAVGESIAARVGEAIAACDYLVAILSTASVASAWVREELDAAHVVGIESGGTVILPALLEDCAVPAMLRAKKYADFRRSYKRGLATLLESIHRLRQRKGSPGA